MSFPRDNTPEPATPSTPDSTRSVMAKLNAYHEVRGDFASNYIADRQDDDDPADREAAAIAAAIASGRFPGRAAKKKEAVAANAADGSSGNASEQDAAASNHKGKSTQAKRPARPINPEFTRTTRRAARTGSAAPVENYNDTSEDEAKLPGTSYDFHTKEFGPLKMKRPESANHAAAIDSGDSDDDLAAMGISTARIEELNGAVNTGKAKSGKKVSPHGYHRAAREAREDLRADESVKRDMHKMLSADGLLETDPEQLVAAAQEIQKHYEELAGLSGRNSKRKISAIRPVDQLDGPAPKKRKTIKSAVKVVPSTNVEPRRSKRKAAQAVDEDQVEEKASGTNGPVSKKRKVNKPLPTTIENEKNGATDEDEPIEPADNYVYPLQATENRNSKWSIKPRLRAMGKQRPTETFVSRKDGSVSAIASDHGDSEFGDIHRRAADDREVGSDADDVQVDNDLEQDVSGPAVPAVPQSTVIAAIEPASALNTTLTAPHSDAVVQQTASKKPVKSKTATKIAKAKTPQSGNSTTSKRVTRKRKRSDSDDDDEDGDAADAADAVAPKSKKAKANATIPQDWVGQPSGHGYSAGPPPNAQLTEPWQCGDRMCASGMTWLKHLDEKDKEISSVGRKVISHFFGRNKASTRSIPKKVWHWLCRKHYQREKYKNEHAKNEIHEHQATAMFYLENVEHQVVRLENWRPHATFKIQLMTGADHCLQHWYKHLAEHNGNTQTAAATYSPPEPKKNKQKAKPKNKKKDDQEDKEKKPQPETHFPILSLVHMSDNFCGDNKSYVHVRQLLLWIRGLLTAGSSPVMAPVEILIDTPWTDEDGNEEPINDFKYSYQQWEAHVQGKPFDLAHAYTPREGHPIPIFKPFKAPAPDHFEDVETSSNPDDAAIRNAAKMGCVVSDGNGGVMVATKPAAKAGSAGKAVAAVKNSEEADDNAEAASDNKVLQADNKRNTRPRRNAAQKTKK